MARHAKPEEDRLSLMILPGSLVVSDRGDPIKAWSVILAPGPGYSVLSSRYPKLSANDVGLVLARSSDGLWLEILVLTPRGEIGWNRATHFLEVLTPC